MMMMMMMMMIIIINQITLLNICVLGNLHLSKIVGGIERSRGRKCTLSLKVRGRVLGIYLLYDTFVIVSLFVPPLRCFWLNLYSVGILGSFW